MHLSIEQQLKSQKLQSNLYQLQAIGLKLERDQAEVKKRAEETEAALVAYIKAFRTAPEAYGPVKHRSFPPRKRSRRT